jgi:hypothetical protein
VTPLSKSRTGTRIKTSDWNLGAGRRVLLVGMRLHKHLPVLLCGAEERWNTRLKIISYNKDGA